MHRIAAVKQHDAALERVRIKLIAPHGQAEFEREARRALRLRAKSIRAAVRRIRIARVPLASEISSPTWLNIIMRPNGDCSAATSSP